MTDKEKHIIDYLSENKGEGFYIEIREKVCQYFENESDFDKTLKLLEKKNYIYETEYGITFYRLKNELEKSKYALFELEISRNWKINRNEFYKIDPKDDIPEDDKFSYIYIQEDMLWLNNGEYHIDLGWYGEDDGKYSIHFFKGSWLVGELLEKFSSKKSLLIFERLNEILTAFDNGEFDNIKGYMVNENDFNNQSDFGDLDNYEPRKN